MRIEALKEEYTAFLSKWKTLAYDENGNEKNVNVRNRSMFELGKRFIDGVINYKYTSDMFPTSDLFDTQTELYLNMMRVAIKNETDSVEQ